MASEQPPSKDNREVLSPYKPEHGHPGAPHHVLHWAQCGGRTGPCCCHVMLVHVCVLA